MSHRVSTTLDDDTWGALDLMREQEGVDHPEMLRRLVERAVAAFRADVTGLSGMALVHPALRPSTNEMADCTCVTSCADDPATACSLSGIPHVHPNRHPGDVFGPCPVHPDAPGDH